MILHQIKVRIDKAEPELQKIVFQLVLDSLAPFRRKDGTHLLQKGIIDFKVAQIGTCGDT